MGWRRWECFVVEQVQLEPGPAAGFYRQRLHQQHERCPGRFWIPSCPDTDDGWWTYHRKQHLPGHSSRGGDWRLPDDSRCHDYQYRNVDGQRAAHKKQRCPEWQRNHRGDGRNCRNGNLVDFWNQTVNNYAVATLTGGIARIRMPGGTFNNRADGTVKLADGVGFDGLGSGTFNNFGTVVKEGNISDFSETAFGLTVNNAGAIISRKGIVRFTAAFTQTTGATSLEGGSMRSTNPLMNFQGGTLTGFGKLTANVQVSGTAIVAPGVNGPGLLEIVGTYTQSDAGSALNIQLAGDDPFQFDRLTISGTATLGGTLNVTPVNFVPDLADTFVILSFSGAVGDFSSVNATGFTLEKTATTIVLRPTGDLPCSTRSVLRPQVLRRTRRPEL